MVYVTGDMHGDIKRFSDPALKKLKKGDILIVCGDFGFIWDGSRKEAANIRRLQKKKYDICFIDGTHENFDALNALPVTTWEGGKVHEIAPNIRHLMRGQIFKIDNMTYFTMGGGESPDIDIRFETNSWSKDEFPSRDEMIEGANNLEALNCKVDFIITHEPPVKVKSFLKLKDGEQTAVNGLNSYFEELAGVCTYRRWFFGSLHLDKYVSSSLVSVYKNIIAAVTGEIA